MTDYQFHFDNDDWDDETEEQQSSVNWGQIIKDFCIGAFLGMAAYALISAFRSDRDD